MSSDSTPSSPGNPILPSPPKEDGQESNASANATPAPSPAAAAAPAAATAVVTAAEINDAWAVAKAKGDAAARAGAAVAADSRAQYEALPRDIQRLKERLELAKAKLAKMDEVVTRYAGVTDPVVASDGFTYNRQAIEDYVTECRNKGLPAVSHQTKQELRPVFTDNRSLLKLVDTLKPMVTLPADFGADETGSSFQPTPPPQVAPIG